MIFRWGEFTSAAGQTLPFKIECDGLTSEDWDCLARMVAARVEFGSVEGVPRGGLPFAEALAPLATEGPLLVVDDVFTTGASIKRHLAGRKAQCVVVFSRAKYMPFWIHPLFWLNWNPWPLPKGAA